MFASRNEAPRNSAVESGQWGKRFPQIIGRPFDCVHRAQRETASFQPATRHILMVEEFVALMKPKTVLDGPGGGLNMFSMLHDERF